MTESLQDWIHKCQDDLEKVYCQLGERLLSLVSLVNGLREASVNEVNLNPLRETRKVVNQVSELMEETGLTRKGLGQFINEFRQNLRQLRVIDQNITRIHEYSEIMELLAMNTVVFSVQSVKDVGFLMVADILRQNAKTSMQRIEEIVDIGRELREQFTLLEETILKLKRSESIKTYTEKKIRGSLSVVEDSQEYFAETTALLDEELTVIHQDLLKIVQEIQYQDIFRQSLDHILLLLQEEPKAMDGPEERLDHLSYLETVCRFSIPLLEEILIRVDGSVILFQTRLEAVRSDIHHVMSKRRAFLQDNLQKSRKRGGLLCSIGDLKSGLTELGRELIGSGKNLKNIDFSTEKAAGVLNLLREKIVELDSLILTYYNIAQMGKKEMLKHNDQEFLKDSLENINKLARKMEKTGIQIHKAVSVMDEGRTPVRENIRELKEGKARLTHQLDQQGENLRVALASLLEGVKKLQEQNSSSAGSVRSELAEALVASGELKSISTDLHLILGGFRNLEQKIIDDKECALKETGKDSWNVQNRDYKSLLDRFTIYRQKLALSQLTGVSQKDEGLKEGNIILF